MSINLTEETKSVVSKQEPKIDSLSEGERDDIFTQLLMGKDATGEVETSRGKFVVKFPKEKDKIAIGRLMCINRGGLPISSFDVETENRNLICSTLNVLVTGAPKWFEDAKKKVKNFSFEEVPDEEFLLELYQKACSFRNEVQESFRKGKRTESAGLPATKGMADNVGPNVHDGDEKSTDR